MHSVRLEIGKKIFDVMVRTGFKDSPHIEFPQNFPGSSSYEESNESHLRWILNELRTGDKLHVTVGQHAKIFNPGDNTPMLDTERALGKYLKFKDLPEGNLRGLTDEIASYAQQWE